MLSAAPSATADPFAELRAREFGRLDEQGVVYLDYAAAALYGASQARAHADRLLGGVFGNPHSEHAPSLASEAAIEAARAAALAHFGADPAVYDLCFTANTSAAVKLVAESFPFNSSNAFVSSADNHNSINGIREYARRAGAALPVLPLCPDLSLDDPAARLASVARSAGGGLFAFPAQSNFSGVRHPLALVGAAQAVGFAVLIDAAGLGPVPAIDLRSHPAEFLAFSFYKLFGLPTGVGGLIAKRTALEALRRPWFAGGTVDFVSVAHLRHRQRPGAAGFEDGTPNFLDIAAVQSGFEFLGGAAPRDLQRRLTDLTRYFLAGAQGLAHPDGSPLVEIYGPDVVLERGGTVALNVLRRDGTATPYQQVERRALKEGIALRGGCFCNPGAAEAAFGFHRHDIARVLDDLGPEFTIERLQDRLEPHAVGAVRLSVGLPTTYGDLDRALDLLRSFAAR